MSKSKYYADTYMIGGSILGCMVLGLSILFLLGYVADSLYSTSKTILYIAIGLLLTSITIVPMAVWIIRATRSVKREERESERNKTLFQQALVKYLSQFPEKNQQEFLNYLAQCPEEKRQEILLKILLEYGM